MNSGELLRRRLVNQRLIGTKPQTPADAVSWLVAVQAQEYRMARWALGLRLAQATDHAIEQTCDQGEILRTHVLRPTWHFVTPSDIRWMLDLSAPRIRAAMAYNDRKLSIDRRLIRRAQSVFEKALQQQGSLTRGELTEILARNRIHAQGPQLGHLLMHAELDGLICSGPRRGKQSTYALLDQRAPMTPTLSRGEALLELGRRYFSSRGPATAHDFAWWSGLTVTDAVTAIDGLGREFVRETYAGRRLVWLDTPVPRSVASANFFLPDYDEYGIAYKDRSDFFETAGGEAQTNRHVAFNRMIVMGGRVRGSWRPAEVNGEILIDAAVFSPFRGNEKRAADLAAAEFGKFFSRKTRVTSRVVSQATSGVSSVRIVFGAAT